MQNRLRKNVDHTLIYVSLIVLGVILLFPIIWMLSVSLRSNLEATAPYPSLFPAQVMFDSYLAVLGNARFLRSFWNSYYVSLTVTILALVVGSLAGYGIARFNFKGKGAVILFLLITQTFPLVLLSLPYFVLMIQIGLYNTLTSLILVYLSFCLPFSILMLRNYFRDLPVELEEAAMVDGCTRLRALWRVTIRLSGPAMIGTGLYTFLLAWNEFLFAQLLTDDWSTRVLTMAIYSLLSEFVTDWSAMMAFSMLASLPIFIAFVFLQRYVIRGMTMGAIK